MARSSGPPDKAVILARGLGTRMRQANPSAALDPEQRAMADAGLKAMIPVGRPFLDYVLSGLADAGIRSVCLVIGPEHGAVRERYLRLARPSRLAVGFAIQAQPRGTADAVLAAEGFPGTEPFLVLNSDNLYPAAALRALRELDGPGLVGYERAALLSHSNIDAERIRRFALIEASSDGLLTRIVEKPDAAAAATFGEPPLVSMNNWCFTPVIFQACRAIRPSARGELELQDAVRHAIHALGAHFRVLRSTEGVLDLSGRADILAVAERLRGVDVRL